MHITTVYVEPKDILNNLSEEYKDKFNKCVFTDCQKMMDGTVNITCLLIDDREDTTMSEYRYKVVLSPEPVESEETDETEEIKETEEITE
jgi:hypothetical protein